MCGSIARLCGCGGANLAPQENKEQLEKWLQLRFPAQDFYAYPEAVKTLFSTRMHNFIRYYGHSSGRFEICVEGEYRDARVVLANLQCDGEKIVSKNNPQEVWTYLEKGLTRWDATDWSELQVCAKLSSDEFQYAVSKAKLLASRDARIHPTDATCVVEVVSSWLKSDVNLWTGGYLETFDMPRHPWLRLISADGSVRIVGFGWQKPITADEAAATVKGVFRSPDPWEAMNFQARPITRISATENELNRIIKLTEEYQKAGMAFNFVQHNCTRYVQHILNTLGFDVNVEATWSEIAARIMPVWIQILASKINRALLPVKRAICWLYGALIPPILQKIGHFVLRKLSTLKNLLVLSFGGLKGRVLRHFPRLNSKSSPRRGALIRSIGDFFKERLVQPILPRKLIEWQMKQISTSVYPSSLGFHGQYGRTRLPFS